VACSARSGTPGRHVPRAPTHRGGRGAPPPRTAGTSTPWLAWASRHRLDPTRPLAKGRHAIMRPPATATRAGSGRDRLGSSQPPQGVSSCIRLVSHRQLRLSLRRGLMTLSFRGCASITVDILKSNKTLKTTGAPEIAGSPCVAPQLPPAPQLIGTTSRCRALRGCNRQWEPPVDFRVVVRSPAIPRSCLTMRFRRSRRRGIDRPAR